MVIRRLAWSLDIFIFAAVMAGDLLSDSMKFDFLSQPLVVVLSVMERMHVKGGHVPSSISIQGPIMDARCSSMFSVAQNWSQRGI